MESQGLSPVQYLRFVGTRLQLVKQMIWRGATNEELREIFDVFDVENVEELMAPVPTENKTGTVS